jgi:hypothetical protein
MDELTVEQRLNTSTIDGHVDHADSSPVRDGDEDYGDKPMLDAGLVHEWPLEKDQVSNPEENMLIQETMRGKTIVYEDNVGTVLEKNSQIDAIPSPEELSPAGAAAPAPLLDQAESELYRTHWNEVQARFVDDPRAAVQQADMLVTEVIRQISNLFATEHGKLDAQWKQGDEVSTEDLRLALQHYRAFFNRLVV